MKKNMTSKERMLAAIKQQEVDYIPCSIYFNTNMIKYGYNGNDIEEGIKFHKELGVDPTINMPGIDAKIHPEVETKSWCEDINGEKYPVLYKEFNTPKGTLRMGVKLTPEWPYGMDIPFPGNDFHASHNFEPLIKTSEDIKKFEYLWVPPDLDDINKLRGKIKKVKELAAKYEILTTVSIGLGLAEFMFLMGAQNLIYFAMDYPEALKQLAEIESRANIARIGLYEEIGGVDLMKRFGGYEQTNFFNPEIFKHTVEPQLRNEVAAAKKSGILLYYRVVTGMKPLLSIYSDLRFDCMEGFEPSLSDCSNSDIVNSLGGRTCIWTGISSPGHIGSQEGEEPVRKAVRNAVDVFGKRGFILGVTNSIRAHWPWNNTLAMIDEWKKVRM